MAHTIKFCGRSKRESTKKAVEFYYDNLENNFTLEVFLAKCRVQLGGKTIHYYPYLNINITEYRKFKNKKRQQKKDNK